MLIPSRLITTHVTAIKGYIFMYHSAFLGVTNEYFDQDARNKQCKNNRCFLMIHTNHKSAFRGQNVVFFNLKPGGT